ncbi:MAG: DUF4292 domain-containing protein [Candidatus Cyclobacteriaceae bacterium M2_1C_046]
MSRLILSLILISILFLAGCGKKLTDITWDFREKKALDVREIDFEYFSGKAKINFKDSDHDVKAKANIRIKKDSLIWITFSAVGIQGARVLMNRDSITILNLMKKEYYVFYYDSLSKKFNFDINFESIQATALGNLIFEREEDDEVIRKEEFYILRQASKQVLVDNFVNRETRKIERVEMIEPQSVNKATIIYQDFNVLEDRAFPFSAAISLFYAAKQGTLNTIINFEYSKAEFEDKELKFPFTISTKYERK